MFENLSADIVRAQHHRAEQPPFPALLKSALENPLFYPATDQWMFPGDSFAILLQSNLARPREVVGGLLEHLSQLKIDSNDVVVVISFQMAEQFGITPEQLKQSESEVANGKPPSVIKVDIGDEKISFQVHDPANNYGLAYLAANEAGDPVHINRLLADVDVVIPVGCPSPGDQQRHDCLYPDFGSADRLEQFRIGAGSDAQRNGEIELANENLGTFFALEIVSAPGGEIAAVVAGTRKDVFEQSKQLADELWTVNFVANCQTVLATIEEQGHVQSWEDFADAVINAAHVSNGSGPILVWTSINQTADRKTRKALQAQFDDSINTKFSVRQRAVASIISERPIFLRSELSQSQTEELGLGYLESEREVETILAKFESAVLLRDAHRCRIAQPQPASQ